MSDTFPDAIRKLPEASLAIQGARAYLSQAPTHQILFMEFAEDAEVPAHSHAAQFGIVLEGKIELTISGDMRIYAKGERYYIPGGAEHSAKIYAGYADVTFFDEPGRYRAK